MLRTHPLAAAAALCLALAGAAQAQTATLTFDDALRGRLFYAWDGDANGTPDVVLSTGDIGGFNTNGPGPNMLFINEPGIEGTALLAEDLRVNFLQGAVGSLAFSYALSTSANTYGVTTRLYDVNNVLLATDVSTAGFQPLPVGQSAFPEQRASIAFTGTAAYATFNFGTSPTHNGVGGGGDTGIDIGATPTAAALEDPPPAVIDGPPPGRYIIDNLSFTYAGTNVLPGFDGVVPSDPVLPLTEVLNPDGSVSFNFGLLTYEGGLGVAQPIFIDPVVAVGYTYVVDIGANVVAVLVPGAVGGDGQFTLELDGVGSFALQAGVEFDIGAVVAGGVRSFRITGIDAAAGLDPADQLAFVTGLRFASAGVVEISQTAITQAVPEPATYALWLAGAGLAAWRRRALRRA